MVLRGRARGVHDHVQVLAGNRASAANVGNLVTDLGDDDSGRPDQRRHVIRADAKAVAAVGPGGRQRQQDRIGPQRARCEDRGQRRVVAREQVEHPGPQQRLVRARAGVGDEPQVISVLGPHRFRARNAQEATDARQARALAGQGLRQRQRLPARLAPRHGIAWPQVTRQVQLRDVVVFDAHAGRESIRNPGTGCGTRRPSGDRCFSTRANVATAEPLSRTIRDLAGAGYRRRAICRDRHRGSRR